MRNMEVNLFSAKTNREQHEHKSPKYTSTTDFPSWESHFKVVL